MQLLPVEHKEDLHVLPPDILRDTLREINSLRENPYKGDLLKPLKEHQVHTRGLADCRVLKIPGPFELGLRVVYRLVRDETAVEVVAVGPRKGSLVYRMAMARLGLFEERKEVPRWKRLGRPR